MKVAKGLKLMTVDTDIGINFAGCQCNGHSKCLEPGACDQPCKDNTVGDHCEKCAEGYFGNPVNDSTCKGKSNGNIYFT